MDRLNNLPPDEQLLADGLWYLGNMARTHECIAAVLARYHALEAEIDRLQAVEAAAIAQSEYIQMRGLTEYELARLQAENNQLNEACDRIARAGPREIDARELPY